MKIFFFLPNIGNKGGVERALISLLNALVYNKTCDLTLIVFQKGIDGEGFEIDSKIKVLVLGFENYKTQIFSIYSSIKRLIKQEKPDVFVSVESMSLLFTLIPIVFVNQAPKHIVWEHFNYYNNNGRKLRSLFRFLSKWFLDGIVTLTKRDMETWQDKLKIKDKVTYIYNITPFEMQDVSYNKDSKLVIAIGRYVAVKGFDRLIKSWAIIEKKYDIGEWRLNIIGYGVQKKLLENLIKKDKLKSISLIDGTKNINAFYDKASFCCVSSIYEGLPMVMIEAQTKGLPTIAFDIYTGPEEIINNKAGILVKNGDIEAFADAIYRLIVDVELREKMSHEAILLRCRFAKESVSTQWVQLFEKVIQH